MLGKPVLKTKEILENWRRFIPTDIEPKATGHSQACEDSELNICICGKVGKDAKQESESQAESS